MKTGSENRILWIYLTILLTFVTSCVPGPPPPAGLGFGPATGGIWLFYVVLIVLVVWALVKKNKTGPSGRDKEITKSLHQINERLEELERQIRYTKNSTQGGNHE